MNVVQKRGRRLPRSMGDVYDDNWRRCRAGGLRQFFRAARDDAVAQNAVLVEASTFIFVVHHYPTFKVVEKGVQDDDVRPLGPWALHKASDCVEIYFSCAGTNHLLEL